MMIGILAACGPGDAEVAAPPPANGTDPAPPDNGGDDPPAPGNDEPAAPPAPADATVLTFWTFGDTHADYYAEAQRIWNERNPDRQIYLETTVIAFAQMHENLLMALQTGDGAPDIVDVFVADNPYIEHILWSALFA
jgi:arabinosaccharide transport system substrate-binding protein